MGHAWKLLGLIWIDVIHRCFCESRVGMVQTVISLDNIIFGPRRHVRRGAIDHEIRLN